MKKSVITVIGCIVLVAALVMGIPAQADICVKAGQIQLSWTANPEPDVSHYDVYHSDAADGEYSKIATVAGTGHTAIGLAEGDHFFKLKAVDMCGNESEFSDPSEVVRIDTTPPGKPGTITVTIVVE